MWSYRIQVEKPAPIRIRNDSVGDKQRAPIHFHEPMDLLVYLQQNAYPVDSLIIYQNCTTVSNANSFSLQYVHDWFCDVDTLAYSYNNFPKVLVVSNLPANGVSPWFRTEPIDGWRTLTEEELKWANENVELQNNIKRVKELYAAREIKP